MALEIEFRKKAIILRNLSFKVYVGIKKIEKYFTRGLESLLEVTPALKKVSLGDFF